MGAIRVYHVWLHFVFCVHQNLANGSGSRRMAPKKGIVRSGNAGNSSKATKKVPDAQDTPDKPPALFPPGYKYPLTLLNERYLLDFCYHAQVHRMGAFMRHLNHI